ncbi:hypothetical protein M8J75_001592 [Diaphorina citri]|nr:hypothetical protein M8J75_001592 [Diaphorina citri]
MESLLSKIFKSKNKKQVYNVDKSKRQNLKKVNKNVGQKSSAYITNKLRKEFGIYRPKSEFSSTKYNMPCLVTHCDYSIENVDIIPQTFHREQNVDLVKCTLDQRKTKNSLFINDNHSDMEAESINKEFGIDENEVYGSRTSKTQNPTNSTIDDTHKRNNMEEVKSKSNENSEKQRYNERNEYFDRSVEESSIANTDSRKESLQGRYQDPCKQLNSYKCNGEFIFEPKKDLTNERYIGEKPIESNTFNDSIACTLNKSAQKSGADAKLGYIAVEKGMVEEIQDLNKFLITKKGRIKYKPSEKGKINKHDNKSKEDDGLSRHRNYHSMIILGRKKKVKTTHRKNVKITNNEILEVTQKKFGGKNSHLGSKISLDYMPFDKNRPNLPYSHSTEKQMCYRNSNNKFCTTSIPLSEHTLKWLDENFGPGSKNTTIVDSEENEEFSDNLEEEKMESDENRRNYSSSIIDIETEKQEYAKVPDKNKEIESNKQESSHCIAEAKDNNEIENKDSVEPKENNDTRRKTVRVVSFRKSRTLKSSANSNEKPLEENNVDSHKFTKTVDGNVINEDNQNPFTEELDATSTVKQEKSEGLVENKETAKETEIILKATNENCDDVFDIELKTTSHNEATSGKKEAINSIEKHNSELDMRSSSDAGLKVSDDNNQKIKIEDKKDTKKQDSERIISENVTHLKLQNENIFGILREQEKRNLAQESQKVHTNDIEEDKINYCSDSPSQDSAIKHEKRHEEKVILKLNGIVLDVDEQMEKNMEKYNQNIERNENKAYNKIKAQNIKRRQEELEKDYIMTRLELALNTDVIQKPEMAKYILEKSQEVIKDVVEKTNENITKKLMAQSNTELIKCRDESPIGNSINSSRSHEKGNDFIKEKIETKRNMEIGIGMIDKNANINEETVKHVDNQKMIDLLVKERKDNTNR